jgi:RimJ/RimL family protein N-acetyltransferase
LKVLETERLVLRRLTPDDGRFILELLNDPAWLRFIGDKGVKTLDDARNYIVNGPMDMYARLGFGLYGVERKPNPAPIGICGLIKRDGLEDVDIGFAFLSGFRAKGYALEAAAAVMEHARNAFGLRRLVAITSPENEASIRLLGKLGLRFERRMRLAADSPEVSLFAAALQER